MSVTSKLTMIGAAGAGGESEWIATWHAGESRTYYRTTLTGMLPSASYKNIFFEVEERYYNGSTWSPMQYQRVWLNEDGNVVGQVSDSTFDRASYNNYQARHAKDPRGEVIYCGNTSSSNPKHFSYHLDNTISGLSYSKSAISTSLTRSTRFSGAALEYQHTAVGTNTMCILGSAPTGTYRGGGSIWKMLTNIGVYDPDVELTIQEPTSSVAVYTENAQDEYITIGCDDSIGYYIYLRHFNASGTLLKSLRWGPTYNNTRVESRIVQDPSNPDRFWFAFTNNSTELNVWCYNANTKVFDFQKKYTPTTSTKIEGNNQALQIGVDNDYVYIATYKGQGDPATKTGLLYRQDKAFTSNAERILITGNDNVWSSNYSFYMDVSPTGMIYYAYSSDIPANTSWYSHLIKAKWDTLKTMPASTWQGGFTNNGTMTVSTDTVASSNSSFTASINTSGYSTSVSSGSSTPASSIELPMTLTGFSPDGLLEL